MDFYKLIWLEALLLLSVVTWLWCRRRNERADTSKTWRKWISSLIAGWAYAVIGHVGVQILGRQQNFEGSVLDRLLDSAEHIRPFLPKGGEELVWLLSAGFIFSIIAENRQHRRFRIAEASLVFALFLALSGVITNGVGGNVISIAGVCLPIAFASIWTVDELLDVQLEDIARLLFTVLKIGAGIFLCALLGWFVLFRPISASGRLKIDGFSVLKLKNVKSPSLSDGELSLPIATFHSEIKTPLEIEFRDATAPVKIGMASVKFPSVGADTKWTVEAENDPYTTAPLVDRSVLNAFSVDGARGETGAYFVAAFKAGEGGYKVSNPGRWDGYYIGGVVCR